MVKRYDITARIDGKTHKQFRPDGEHVSYADHAALAESHARLLEALNAAIQCGMVPSSSTSEGGANRHVVQIQVADQIRDVIAAAQPFTDMGETKC